jgi:6-phosphogluconolactonase
MFSRTILAMKVVLPLLLVLTTYMAARENNNFVVYVGTYTDSGSKGVYSFRFDAKTGFTGPLELAATSDNPSFLAVDPSHRFLYAANEIESFGGKSDGSISVFAIEPKTSKLTAVQQVSSVGWGPVYVSLDQTARHLLVANYGAGTIAVLPILSDGRLGPPTTIVAHLGTKANPARPHAIYATNDNRFVLVPDLGLNKLFVYRFDASKGSLTADAASVAFDRNSGPRHLAISPSGKFIYLVNEHTSTVSVFSADPSSGALREQQTVSSLAPDFAGPNTEAGIALDTNGKYLYVSNRGEDSIVAFRVDPKDGTLTFLQRIPTGGRTPRAFALDPTGKWLFAANQGSNSINLFKVDPHTGRLAATSKSLSLAAPAHLIFVPIP